MPIIANADEKEFENVPTIEEKNLLIRLLYESTLWGNDWDEMKLQIDNCMDYKIYEKMQYFLESMQKPFDHIVNPNAGDINKHLKNLINRV